MLHGLQDNSSQVLHVVRVWSATRTRRSLFLLDEKKVICYTIPIKIWNFMLIIYCLSSCYFNSTCI